MIHFIRRVLQPPNMKHLPLISVLIITLGLSLCIPQDFFLSVFALSPPDIATSILQVKNTILPERNLDRFGVEMIYPTKVGGEQWYLNMQNPMADGRFDPQDKITRNPDGSWKMKSDKVRMGVYTSRGYHLGDVSKTLLQSELIRRGYMQSNSDWKNVEITGYVKLNAYTENDNFVWYTRGGKHSDADPCEGAGYKGNLNYFGQVQFSKEQWHVSYVKSPYKHGIGPLLGHWTGFKVVEYNFNKTQGNQGQIPVKLEIWVDPDADGKNWNKVYEGGDAGHWGRTGESCGGLPDQVLGWGGPVAAYRWDFAPDVDFKDLSVREIVPVGGVTSNIVYFDGFKSGYGDGFGGNGKSFSNDSSRIESGNVISAGSRLAPRDNNSGFEMPSILPIHILRNDSDVVESPFEHNKEKILRVGNNTYVLWVEGDEDNTDIYLKISHNNGMSFGKPINLSNNPASLSYNPDLAESNGNIYIVWEDDSGNSGNTDIFFIKSTDNGVTWSERKNLSNDPSGSGDPRISVVDGIIYVTWLGTTPDKTNLAIVESKDNGLTFSGEVDINPKANGPLNEISNATSLSTLNNNDTNTLRDMDNNDDIPQDIPKSNFTNYESVAINGTGVNATYQQNNSLSMQPAILSKNSTVNDVSFSDKPLVLNNSRTLVVIAKEESANHTSKLLDNPYIDTKRNISKIETDLAVHTHQDGGLSAVTNMENGLRNNLSKQFEHRENDSVIVAQAKTALQNAESNLYSLQSLIAQNKTDRNLGLDKETIRSIVPLKTLQKKANPTIIDEQASKNAISQAENGLYESLRSKPFDDIGPHSNDKQIKAVNNSHAVTLTELSNQHSHNDPTINTISKNQSFSPVIIDKKQPDNHSNITRYDNLNGIDIVPVAKDKTTALQQAETKLRSMKDVHLTEKFERSNYKNEFGKEPVIPTETKNKDNVIPSAEGDKVNTLNDKAVVIRLHGKDNDGPEPLSFTIVNQPRHGKINAFNELIGKLTYVPSKGYTGQDSFKYIVSDGISHSKVAVISLKIDRGPVPHIGINLNKEKILTNTKKSLPDSQGQEQLQTKKKEPVKSTEEGSQADRVSKLEDRTREHDSQINKNENHENKPEEVLRKAKLQVEKIRETIKPGIK